MLIVKLLLIAIFAATGITAGITAKVERPILNGFMTIVLAFGAWAIYKNSQASVSKADLEAIQFSMAGLYCCSATLTTFLTTRLVKKLFFQKEDTIRIIE